MALVVQTMPPTAGANSYNTLDEFKAYCAERLKVIVGKTDEQILAALLEGTQFLDLRFDYKGYRYDAGQSTEFPRQNLWDNRGDRVDGIPPEVKQACNEYAFRALNGALWNDPTRDPSGQQVKSKSSKIGPIEESVEYADRAGHELPSFPMVDRLLTRRGLVAGGTVSGLSVLNTARG